jgi:hypothetical protein
MKFVIIAYYSLKKGTKMEINLKEFEGIFEKAIFQALDQEKKDILIQGALESLLKKSTERYDYGKSELEKIFEQSLSIVARNLITKSLLEDNQITDQIDTLFKDVIKLVMETNREETVRKMADILIEGMFKKEY